jgi:MFS family permease
MGNGYKSGGKYAVPAKTVSMLVALSLHGNAAHCPSWNASAAPAQILGQFFTAPIADYFGRRAVIYSSIAIMLLGVVLEILAPNWQTFAAASFIMKVVAGLVQSTAPLYISELAPRPIRGVMVCCFLLISKSTLYVSR